MAEPPRTENDITIYGWVVAILVVALFVMPLLVIPLTPFGAQYPMFKQLAPFILAVVVLFVLTLAIYLVSVEFLEKPPVKKRQKK